MSNDPRKITDCKITDRPKSFTDPLPKVLVRLDSGSTWHELFDFFPDEIDFKATELMGLTPDEARELKRQKDLAFLRS